MATFISTNPNPLTISLALHFACLNVAMFLCAPKIIAHKNECGCQFVHVHVCVDVCMGVCVCMCLAFWCPSRSVCVWMFVCLSRWVFVCKYVCVHARSSSWRKDMVTSMVWLYTKTCTPRRPHKRLRPALLRSMRLSL